jgi:hypothetical protein
MSNDKSDEEIKFLTNMAIEYLCKKFILTYNGKIEFVHSSL